MISLPKAPLVILALCLFSTTIHAFEDSFETQPAPLGEIRFAESLTDMQGSCLSARSFGLAFGDLNFDGWPELISFSHLHNNFPNSNSDAKHCVWLNQNGQSFMHSDAASNSLTDVKGITCTWSAQITDMTGDGKPDIWCRGSEAGSDFYENTTSAVGGTPSFRHIDAWASDADKGYKDEYRFFDFNGDGQLARISDAGIIMRIADGKVLTETNIENPGVFDINGDTFPDIWSAKSQKILLNDGKGKFTEVAYDANLDSCNTWSLYHTDFDTDGDIDLFCTTTNPNQLNILRNDGNQRFTVVKQLVLKTNAHALNKGTLSIADFDNNGLLDILYVVGYSRNVRLYQQVSPLEFIFKEGRDVADGDHQFGDNIAVSDIDNDGLLDAAMQALDGDNNRVTAMLYHNKTTTDNRYVSVIVRGDDMGAGKNTQAQGALIYAIDPNTQDVINSVYVGNDWRHVGPNFAFHLPVKQHQKVHLKVIWPSGFEQSQLFTNIDSNQTYRIQYRQDRDDVLSLWQAGNGW